MKMFIREEFNADDMSLKKIHIKINKLRINLTNLLIR